MGDALSAAASPRIRRHAGALWIDGVPAEAIAAAVGTPVYAYAARDMDDALDGVSAAWAASGPVPLIAFAVKALSNVHVLRRLGARGAGADIVSGGELFRALSAGIAPERIVFSGVGKTADEITAALNAGILQINVESAAELDLIVAISAGRQMPAPVAIRVNPDVDAGTDTRITTGRAGDKFGVAPDVAVALARRAVQEDSLLFRGLAMHIGSQIATAEPFMAAATALADLARGLAAEGIAVPTLDIGGGLAVAYSAAQAPPSALGIAAGVRARLEGVSASLIIEPGRAIVAAAGVLLTRVIRQKPQATRDYVIVDAAMNDLLRPALYGAQHQIIAANDAAVAGGRDIAGPVCESTDVFARDVPLPNLAPGDLLAILTAGAYGAGLASSYNSRPLVPEVLVDGAEFRVIRRRPTLAEMIALEDVPA